MSMADEIQAAHRALAWNTVDERHALRISLEEAASRAGIAARNWARIEAGQGSPKLDTIVRIAVALEIAIGDLFAPVRR